MILQSTTAGLLVLVAAIPMTVTDLRAGEAIPVSRVRTDNSVRIGMNRGMFRDLSTAMLTALAKPFQKLLESQTGLTGEVEMCADANCLARDVYADKLQIGVFHGYEFAWLKEQYPDLEPLLVAVPVQKHLHACLIVRKDDSTASVSALDGKKVALGVGTKEHCRLFIERARSQGDAPLKLTYTRPENIEDALHDVVDGLVNATVVEAGIMNSFASRHPGRWKKLKVIHTETFPLNVVAYRKSAMDEATVARIRQGLSTAHHTAQGKTMMQMWKLGGFETVPASYAEQLASVLKAYPPPPEKTSVEK